ncbi:MAG: PspC domain-containing protein, partial [Bacteroidota bacterium]
MKKNISINIGGIIFHIEEDGYQRLKAYLESINKYFSSFDDSKEIIDDIESRIAEIFLAKLSDVKQVIVLLDVEELIATMGTTKDFQASIETEPPPPPPTSSEPKAEPADESQEEEPSREESRQEPSDDARRLYRDGQRKLLGGVASG